MNSCLNMAPNTSSLNMDPKTAFQSHDSITRVIKVLITLITFIEI